MIKVVGFWERGWIAPINEYDLWYFALREFEIDEFIMIPISGISKEVTEYENLEKVIDDNKKLISVYVTEKGKTELENFKHPKNALYIFDKVGFDPLGKHSIKIATPFNGGGLWPHQAACIILRHRWLSQ